MSKKTIVCRVCLEPQQNAYVSLSEKYRDFVLYEFINTITSLNIRLSDGFPDKICAACRSQLTASIDFKEKCEASDVVLRSNTVKQELLTEYKNDAVKSENVGESIKTEYDDINCDGAVDCTPDFEFEQDVKEENDDEEHITVNIHSTADKPSRAVDLKLICDDCGGSFKSKCKLKVHWKKMHMCESLVCPLCRRTFKSYKAFHQHKKRKTKSCTIAADDNIAVEGVGKFRTFCCKQCDFRSKKIQTLKAHVVTHTGARPFKCDICSNSYTQLSTLNGHREMAHQMYVHQMTCHICGKTVKGRWRIEKHRKLHSKSECPVCHKNISKANYSQHMKRHSGTKSYACEKCTSTFYTIAELCNHRRFRHSSKEEPVIRCEQCEFTCTKKQTMNIHRVKHSSDGIPCTICGKFFLTKEKLVHHQRLHFTEKQHCCPHCEKKFFNRDSWRHHIKAKHSVAELKSGVLAIKTESNSLMQTDGTR